MARSTKDARLRAELQELVSELGQKYQTKHAEFLQRKSQFELLLAAANKRWSDAESAQVHADQVTDQVRAHVCMTVCKCVRSVQGYTRICARSLQIFCKLSNFPSQQYIYTYTYIYAQPHTKTRPFS
jgi:hypothetical protein